MSEESTILEYLALLKAAEKETADLYSYIGQINAIDNPELFGLFSVLAQEELVHAKYFDLLKDFQSDSKTMILDLGDAKESIVAIIEEIRDITKAIHSFGDTIGEEELIRNALAVETSLLEGHDLSAIRITDEPLRKLFQSLKFADEVHIQRLQKFLDEKIKR